jgi:hypothetical protein
MTGAPSWADPGIDQDDMVAWFLTNAAAVQNSAGTQSFAPGSNLPIAQPPTMVNPDGSTRAAKSGQLRIRSYLPQQNYYTALDDLSKVIGGFDFDLVPGWRYSTDNVYDHLRIFYPNQGVTRSDVQLKFPGSLSALTRQLDSSGYANYERVLGNNQSSSAAAAQLYSERWNTDATAAAPTVGLWMDPENASDVVDQSTLDQRAQGYLNRNGVLLPVYSATLTPNAYYSGFVNMGDTVPLIVQSGRLSVNTALRVMGIEYDISDDGTEDIVLTIGAPAQTLIDMLDATSIDVEALARR